MSDACCGPESQDPGAGPERLWQVRELQLAAAAGVLLGLGWLIGRSGYDRVAIAFELLAVAAAASTFVPEALRNLRHGRINVGTLMTIAAIGAVSSARLPRLPCSASCSPLPKVSSIMLSPAPGGVCVRCSRWCPKGLGDPQRSRNHCSQRKSP